MRAGVWRVDGRGASAVDGRVVWAPAKSLWNTGFFATAIALGPATATPGAIALCVVSTYVTMLLGHSLGMHRRLIHRAFDCGKGFERLLVWLGTLVGMAGPFGILRIHDLRDWAQREPACHDFFAHRRGVGLDAFWQLHCRFEFDRPPRFAIEPEFADDPWYRAMEATWPLQQLVLAAALWAIGGVGWAVWGVAVRVVFGVSSHWIVTYVVHNPGPGRWRVEGAAVQASDLVGWGFLTHGECWHNNHHAYPESARLGLEPGQCDPGWWTLRMLQRLGLVHRLGEPRGAAAREDLVASADGWIGGR